MRCAMCIAHGRIELLYLLSLYSICQVAYITLTVSICYNTHNLLQLRQYACDFRDPTDRLIDEGIIDENQIGDAQVPESSQLFQFLNLQRKNDITTIASAQNYPPILFVSPYFCSSPARRAAHWPATSERPTTPAADCRTCAERANSATTVAEGTARRAPPLTCAAQSRDPNPRRSPPSTDRRPAYSGRALRRRRPVGAATLLAAACPLAPPGRASERRRHRTQSPCAFAPRRYCQSPCSVWRNAAEWPAHCAA